MCKKRIKVTQTLRLCICRDNEGSRQQRRDMGEGVFCQTWLRTNILHFQLEKRKRRQLRKIANPLHLEAATLRPVLRVMWFSNGVPHLAGPSANFRISREKQSRLQSASLSLKNYSSAVWKSDWQQNLSPHETSLSLQVNNFPHYNLSRISASVQAAMTDLGGDSNNILFPQQQSTCLKHNRHELSMQQELSILF